MKPDSRGYLEEMKWVQIFRDYTMLTIHPLALQTVNTAIEASHYHINLKDGLIRNNSKARK